MIFDNESLFSKEQAITGSAASTNALDLGAQGTVYGAAAAIPKKLAGMPIPCLIQVVEDFDSSADDGTLTVAVQLDSTETFTPDRSIDLGTFDEADLVAGFQLPFKILPQDIDYQYARLYYTVAGSGNFTAGKVTAGIVAGVQTN